MTIDEIIEQLEAATECAACLQCECETNDIIWRDHVEAVQAAIEQLKKDRWISVNDRLPSREGLMDDETEYVLVRIKLHGCDGYSESIGGYTKDGWSTWDSFGGVNPEDITHWKPLDEKWG